MDRRHEELKLLKKMYRRDRRRTVGFWVFLTCLSGAACLLLAIPCGKVLLPGCPVIILLETYAAYLPGVNSFWNQLAAGIGLNLPVLLGLALLVLCLSVIMWSAGSRKLRRNEAYLSYRTLASALKEEKKHRG